LVRGLLLNLPTRQGRTLTDLLEATMSILAWIVLGLLAGAIAKAIMPGADPGGMIVTMIIGIIGAFLGGWVGGMLTGTGLTGFSLWSLVLAVVGAMLLLWIYRVSTRGRHTTV
jgi:uncharacterized membrane protein YeaQ/YmgE (transglycosylase-associated protein family)